ncbi:MAG: hypothetical protein ACRD6W_04255 [Nitrososphaerales archaeon]
MNRIVLVCGVGVGASLYFLYALFAGIFLERLALSTVTALELVVVMDQFVKVAAAAAHYRTKPPRIEVLLFFFSLDLLVGVAMIVASVAYPSLLLNGLVDTFFSSWIAGIILLLPPYLIFVSVIQVMRSRDPLVVLLSPAFTFSFVAFAASSLVAFKSAFSFADFLQFLIRAIDSALSSGPVPGLSNLYLLVPSLVTFCSLIVRMTIPTPASAPPPRVTFVLPLLAAVVGLAWIYAGVQIAPNTLWSFTVPGVLMAGVLFAFMRR